MPSVSTALGRLDQPRLLSRLPPPLAGLAKPGAARLILASLSIVSDL